MPGGNPIDLSYARQLVHNFKKNDLETGTILTNDTQAVWFSASMLLEALGLSPTLAKTNITGLRFYFGAHGEVTDYPKNAEVAGKLTLVVVQTGTEKIEVPFTGGNQTVYLDIIDDTTTQPAYPDPSKPVATRSTFDEGQNYPPPSDRGLGL